MPMYETLDAIADSYNPLMFLLCLSVLVFTFVKAHYKKFLIYCAGFGIGFLVVYGFRFADHRYQIWQTAGLDYSTHTAVALNLVVFAVLFSSLRFQILAIVSFIAYLCLMLYQGYHTVMDIFSTTAIVLPLILAVLLSAQKLASAQSKR